MSRVTNFVLITRCLSKGQINQLNEWLLNKYDDLSDGFKEVCDKCCGGNKHLELGVYLLAFNYCPSVLEIVKYARTIKWYSFNDRLRNILIVAEDNDGEESIDIYDLDKKEDK